jgi:hypothetical protein
MINSKDNNVVWALLIMDMDEAREHLEDLTNQMSKDGEIDEAEFAAHLGHVYAHLNRIWNSRNKTEEISSDEWSDYSQFPKDLQPVG